MLSFWEDANGMQAEEEEKHLVREFEERLKYNLQQVHALPLTCTHTVTPGCRLSDAPVVIAEKHKLFSSFLAHTHCLWPNGFD